MTIRNPWLDRRPFAWAHQGGAKEGPSNTLLAMDRAMEAGADGLEVDVHLTFDEVLVVCHDCSLSRTTGREGEIRDHTVDQLRNTDAAHFWVPGLVVDKDRPDGDYPERHRGSGEVSELTRVPTLQEVFDRYPDVPLNLELKKAGYERYLADVLAEAGRTDVVVVSFSDRTLRRFRRLSPTTPTAPGMLRLAVFWLASRLGLAAPLPVGTVAIQLPYRKRGVTFIDGRVLRAARRRGVAVHAWTIDDETEMDELLALGVQGIMSDRPTALADRIAAAGPESTP